MSDILLSPVYTANGDIILDAAYTEGASGPIIESVGANDLFGIGHAIVEIVGQNFDASATVTLIDVDGREQAQQVVSISSTVLAFHPILGNLKYGDVTVRVGTNGGTVSRMAVMAPLPGWAYVTMAAPIDTSEYSIWWRHSGIAPQPGDQIVYQQQTTPGNGDVLVFKSGHFEIKGGGSDESFEAFVHSEGQWRGSPGATALMRVMDLEVAVTLIIPHPDLQWQEGQSINVDFSSNFAHATGYRLQGLPNGTGLIFDAESGVLSGTPNAADVAASPLTLVVTAFNDISEASDQIQVVVQERPNVGPIVVSAIPNQTVVERTLINNVDVAPFFDDPDGDSLTFSVSVPHTGSGIRITPEGVLYGRLTEADTNHSPFVVTITASDGRGGEVQTSFQVTVTLADAVRGLHQRLVDPMGTPYRNLQNIHWELLTARSGTLIASGTDAQTDDRGYISLPIGAGNLNEPYFVRFWLADESLSGEAAAVVLENKRPSQNNATGIVLSRQKYNPATAPLADSKTALMARLF